MSTSRGEIPKLSLKERIAALEQRNNAAKKAANDSLGLKPPAGGSVQGRIASFEGKGIVPAPRGSFGLGAPPTSDAASRKRGELYGNRIPQPARNRGAGTPLTAQNTGSSQTSFSGHAHGYERHNSLYGEDFEDFVTQNLPRPDSSMGSQEHTDSVSPLSPMHTGSSSKSEATRQRFTRAQDFATVLEKARKTERRSSIHLRPGSLSPEPRTPSPSLSPAAAFMFPESAIVHEESDDNSNLLSNASISSPKGYGQDATSDVDRTAGMQAASSLQSPPTEPSGLPADDTDDRDSVADPEGSVTSDVLDGFEFSIPEEPESLERSLSPTIPTARLEVDASQEAPTSPALQEATSPKDSDGVPLETVDDQDVLQRTPPARTRSLDAPDSSQAPEQPGTEPLSSGGDTPVEESEVQQVHTSEEVNISVSVPEVKESAEALPSEPAFSVTSPSTPTLSSHSELPPSPAIDNVASLTGLGTQGSPVISISDKPVPELPLDPPATRASLMPQTPRKSMARPASMIEIGSLSPPTRELALEDPPSSSDSGEIGYVTLGPRTTPPRRNMAQVSAYSVVVHNKVTELQAASSRMQFPQTPQINRVRQATHAQPPNSPGYGDLALLMQNAALLEERLAGGDIPSEHKPKPKPELPRELVRSSTASSDRASVDESQRKRKTSFRNTLSRRKSGKKEHHPSPVTIIQPPPRESSLPTIHSAGLPPEEPEPEPRRSLAPKPIPRPGDDKDVLPTPPPKSSPSKYLTGLRRFATSPRSSTRDGASSRRSVSIGSEISSEDSMAVLTPPDSSPDFGPDKDGVGAPGRIAWPTTTTQTTPKKGVAPLGRAASFAEKMWSRTRSKSSASLLSTQEMDENVIAVDTPPKPSSDTYSRLDVPMIPEIPTIVAPAPGTPVRSRSFNALSPAASAFPINPAPEKSSVDRSSGDSLSPSAAATPRPSSTVSISSTSTATMSPLFDKEIFDQFPAVPDIPLASTGLQHARSGSLGLSRYAEPLVGRTSAERRRGQVFQ